MDSRMGRSSANCAMQTHAEDCQLLAGQGCCSSFLLLDVPPITPMHAKPSHAPRTGVPCMPATPKLPAICGTAIMFCRECATLYCC